MLRVQPEEKARCQSALSHAMKAVLMRMLRPSELMQIQGSRARKMPIRLLFHIPSRVTRILSAVVARCRLWLVLCALSQGTGCICLHWICGRQHTMCDTVHLVGTCRRLGQQGRRSHRWWTRLAVGCPNSFLPSPAKPRSPVPLHLHGHHIAAPPFALAVAALPRSPSPLVPASDKELRKPRLACFWCGAFRRWRRRVFGRGGRLGLAQRLGAY